MEPTPTLFDRVTGSLPVYLALWGAFLFQGVLWLSGEAINQVFFFGAGFGALLATAGRRRIVSERRWRQQVADIDGALPQASVSFASAIAFILVLCVCLVALVVGLALIDPHLQRIFGFQVGDVAGGIYELYLKAATPEGLATVAAGTALLAGLALLRQRIRWTRRKPRRGSGGWDGTVRVLPPIPREEDRS